MNQCKICDNLSGNRHHKAREMMFGLRNEFHYMECGSCGCVQLEDIPNDLSKYYPPNYYSFQRHGLLKTFVRHQWSSYAYRGLNPVGWLVTKFFIPNDAMKSVRRAAIPKSARILDVGCGAGNLLQDLQYLGFENVTGADPYIAKDIVYPGGLVIHKSRLADMEDRFDVIMLHHSYEHMDEPRKVMAEWSRLLTPDGLVILRIPIASSYGWKHYGVNWVHLDAPRHLYLHTRASVDFLAASVGLEVTSCIHETNEGSLWASEQYVQDIPLQDSRSYGVNKSRSVFRRQQIKEFKAKAQELNNTEQGDLVCFYLRRKGSR
jgi:2-polyprenyl-3-methyl-5-hydroxy-6-metoxy-1,4-benzoquinol methylase